MSEFKYRNLVHGSAPVSVTPDGLTVRMNKKGTVRFFMASAVVEIQTGTVKHEYNSSRGVIEAPHGAKVLPYYMNRDDWFVVMVEQFRIALPGKTLEPAGGEVDEIDLQVSMARELEEEAHIVVPAEQIEIVFSAYIQPPMMRSKAFGGIVEIAESQLPRELVGGEWKLGEYTVVAVHRLLDLLRARDRMEADFDLETCLLLDAVAKKIGLLKKCY